ncbi:hypothetical protein CkaCkLH20_03855 [Colletotrichum karsti]|uniref:2EXR domain-containing protein n=1 Tax=Colletotrichum karsti TaxID=1095194 RepID=A0A9P6LMZ1_9PEZI|nr:uncharacterized protein CkaCkLH20_03855 [Colletotrichum karsti]KAF9878955.1 hypothetical protein CkaCkLH20_03855 [Colletotrichum karsti]
MEATPSTFHSFKNLPPELRLLIWEASVCVKSPGVKFVSLESNATAQNADGKYVVNLPCCSDEYATLNPSTFYIGQLMACRESRYAVLKQYTTGITAEARLTYRMRLYGRDVSFDSNALPKNDLTILHVLQKQQVDVDKAIEALGLTHRGLNFPLEPIAFEYAESWSFDPRKERFEDMKRGTGPRACFLKLLEPASEGSGEDRQIFHGDGYEFMDAKNHKVLWYQIDWEHAELVDPDTKLMSAWDFLAEVERSLPPHWGSLPKVTILIQPNSLSKVSSSECDLPKLPANLTWGEYKSLSQAQTCSRQNTQAKTDRLEI